nr:MAG TPA: hypothetical protein [Caudoviricetes sp.]
MSHESVMATYHHPGIRTGRLFRRSNLFRIKR